MRRVVFAVLCALLAQGAVWSAPAVISPAANSGLTPQTAVFLDGQAGFDYLLVVWGGSGWTGVSPRYVTASTAVARSIVSNSHLLERVTSVRGREVYRVQRICGATLNEPGFDLDTFENNWEHPRYVLYPGGSSPHAYSNVFAFTVSDIHWTRWGARETYYPLPGDAYSIYRQPMLQVQSAIVAHDVPYGTPNAKVPSQIYQWDPAGDFFVKWADEANYNYGIGDVVGPNVRSGEIVSNWVPSVIWQQDQTVGAPTGVPTFRFEYNFEMGGIFEFDEMGDNPVRHINEVAFFRVLKTDVARHVNDVFEKWPKDADGNLVDLVDANGFEKYTGDVNDPNDPAYPGFAIRNDPQNPWVVQHDPFFADESKATDPGMNWDTVAGTTPYLGIDPAGYVPATTSSVTIAVSGKGRLQWKSLIRDSSGLADAAVWISVDGGEPRRICVGDMQDWEDFEQVFNGTGAEGDHTVKISFVNNSAADPADMAYGYLDNVTWEPFVVYTSNIHGLLKISSPFANTIIPAPWKGYTRDGSPTNDVPVDRLVKPRNLTDGDLLLQYANGGVYRAWSLEKEDMGGEGMWTPLASLAQMPDLSGVTTNVVMGSLYVKPTGGETQRRGYGLWLVRQHPVDDSGNPIPFYLYGQWMTGVETVTIGGVDAHDVAIRYAGANYAAVHDTMLADPDCTRESVINDHMWTGFDPADTIIINTDLKRSLYCFRRERPKRAGGGWYDGWWVYGAGNAYTTNGLATPPGVGFWYERRAAGDMTLTWDGPERYPGEGRDLDVWIVDHADAGDGRTHLAFRFVGESAPKTITQAYIVELFAEKSIRYLHASGATQAEGKAAMDALDPVADARVVPALRNGTGVNTAEELAKGWIWVTVDVPDGSAPADPAVDGTGDTNGAGDLWRIVVGRGVW